MQMSKHKIILAVMICVSLMFIVPTILYAWMPFMEYKCSSTWIANPCTIEYCKSEPGNDERWNYEVRYKYEYQGKIFTGNRYSIDNVHNGSGSGALPPELPLGSSVCFINPQVPECSVLAKELRSQFWPGFYIATGASLFSIIILVITLSGGKTVLRAN